ncbi:phage tail sheath subtilisin-like domain-containing protein [Pseudonocardia endophytica]|uniref:Tail sheath protein C-terminal domain-containing protein n=1 Tax=Pseudonocardia endophytica TaxID=401976 RepID=A0A4R1HQ95_PSEEN|nr:phage tail sheath subtilisin-like domain-containing protein [Pseudonocardia endophytica]TCK22875.1 hypothetical protein EV378_6886 [Pseudonocardia endophytica]
MPDHQTLAPGVHIERIEPTGPIVGVGTSVAAFLGLARAGEDATPRPVFGWDEFVERFGGPVEGSHLATAVRGFFDNGGTTAWVVRVGGAVRSEIGLAAAEADTGDALRLRAREPGAPGDAITVTVHDDPVLPAGATPAAVVRRATGTVASADGRTLTLDDDHASRFARGDTVTTGTSATAVVVRTAADTVVLDRALEVGSNATLRIADLTVGQRSFRVENGAGVEAGTVLHLAQDATAEDVLVDGVAGDLVTVAAPGLAETYALGSSAKPVGLSTAEFALGVSGPAGPEPEFRHLSMDPRHSRYAPRVVVSDNVVVDLPDEPTTAGPAGRRPASTSAPQSLTGGEDVPASVAPEAWDRALTALAGVDEVSIVCLPGVVEPDLQQVAIDHCQTLADRFAILDAPAGADITGAVAHRAELSSPNGYAALYHPWIEIVDPADRTGRGRVHVPPSGHLAGIYAGSDARRGVHKAPANEVVARATGLASTVVEAEQAMLNQKGINALRTFPGRSQPVVWGARTIADETAWRYVPVRRLMLFLEESIQEGLRWAVFETNDPVLWKRLERSVGEFLDRVWKSGALFGTSAEQAYYVRVDEQINPPARREVGEVVVEVGVAPVRPAEFVIVRIGIGTGDPGSGN